MYINIDHISVTNNLVDALSISALRLRDDEQNGRDHFVYNLLYGVFILYFHFFFASHRASESANYYTRVCLSNGTSKLVCVCVSYNHTNTIYLSDACVHIKYARPARDPVLE